MPCCKVLLPCGGSSSKSVLPDSPRLIRAQPTLLLGTAQQARPSRTSIAAATPSLVIANFDQHCPKANPSHSHQTSIPFSPPKPFLVSCQASPSDNTPPPSDPSPMAGKTSFPTPNSTRILFDPRLSLSLHLGTVALIGYSFFNKTLFGYHPTFMALAFLLFMPEAILQAVRGKGKGRKPALNRHMLLNAGAILTGVAGLVAIYLNKERLGKAHLMTLHGKVGALAFVLSSLIATGGLPLLYGFPSFLRKTTLPKMVTQGHKLVGTLAVVLGSLSVLLGLQTFKPAHPLHKGVLTYGLAALVASSSILVLASIANKKAGKGARAPEAK